MDRQTGKVFHKNICEGRSWVWLGKKQYHKEKGKDTLKVVTVLRVNKLCRRCAGTQVQAIPWHLQIDTGHRNGKQQDCYLSFKGKGSIIFNLLLHLFSLTILLREVYERHICMTWSMFKLQQRWERLKKDYQKGLKCILALLIFALRNKSTQAPRLSAEQTRRWNKESTWKPKVFVLSEKRQSEKSGNTTGPIVLQVTPH